MSYEAYKNNQLGFTTRQLHAGYNPAEHYRSKAVPIYQTALLNLGILRNVLDYLIILKKVILT